MSQDTALAQGPNEAMRRLKTESAWQQGAAAFHSGSGVENNPYEWTPEWCEETMDSVGWESGWRWARVMSQRGEQQ